MRLMIFSESFGEVTTTFVRSELDFFLSNNIEVFYVATKKGPVDYCHRNFNFKTIRIEECKFKSFVRIKFKLNFVRFFNHNKIFSQKLNLLINEFKPDALYFHFFNEALLFIDNLFKCNKKFPITIHFHGYDASRLLIYRTYISRIREFNKNHNVEFVFVSKNMKIRLEEKINSTIRGNVLYYGINKNIHNDLKCRKVKNDEVLFLQISSFDERKGHEFSLIGFSKFLIKTSKPEKFKFLIAGSGTDTRTKVIKETIMRLGIGENVELLGSIRESEVNELLSRVDYFVHNSLTVNFDMEGIPIAIMEAMAAGLPIITTNHSGIPELVVDGVSGIIIEENNIGECENAFEKILDFNRPINFNIQRMEDLFEMNRYCDNLKKIIFRLS